MTTKLTYDRYDMEFRKAEKVLKDSDRKTLLLTIADEIFPSECYYDDEQETIAIAILIKIAELKVLLKASNEELIEEKTSHGETRNSLRNYTDLHARSPHRPFP